MNEEIEKMTWKEKVLAEQAGVSVVVQGVPGAACVNGTALPAQCRVSIYNVVFFGTVPK